MKMWMVLCMCLLVLNGCGKRVQEKIQLKKPLVVVHGSGIEMNKVMNEIARNFEKENAGIKLKLLPIEGSDYYAKLETMIAGGTAPDLMWMGKGFSNFVSRGVFLNIDSYISKDKDMDLSRYYEKIVDLYRYEGSLYGFPYGFQSDLLFYNRDLFAREELAYPDDTWTWDTLIEAARRLTKDTDGNGKIDQFGLGGYYWFSVLIQQNGGDILDSSGTKCLLTRPEAVEAIQFIGDLKNKYHVMPNIPILEYGKGEDDLFKMGRIAMYHSARWLVKNLKEVKTLNWNVTLQPRAKIRSSWYSCDGFTISKNTKHPEEAWKFLKYTVSKDAQVFLTISATPSLKELAESDFYFAQTPAIHVHAFIDALEYARHDLRILNADEISSKIDAKLEYVLVGTKTAKEACEAATREINKMLEKVDK